MANQLQPTISLILPMFNEAPTIAAVIRAACQTSVSEIIVVDNGSTDGSAAIVRSQQRLDTRITLAAEQATHGVGAARVRGLAVSSGSVVVFLDTDIQNPSPFMITKLLEPVIADAADFVMADFTNEGRVTELTAKPLLASCFPDLLKLNQPLSGQFACRRELLIPENMLRDDCMIGVLLDAYLAGARLAQVDIGLLLHSKRALTFKKKQALATCRAVIARMQKPAAQTST